MIHAYRVNKMSFDLSFRIDFSRVRILFSWRDLSSDHLASIHPVIVAFTDKHRSNPTVFLKHFIAIVYTEKEEKQFISTCVFYCARYILREPISLL